MTEFDADAVERITAALVLAIAEAKAMAEMDANGEELREVLWHARDLHGQLLEQMAAESTLGKRLRGPSNAFTVNLYRLDEALANNAPRRSN